MFDATLGRGLGFLLLTLILVTSGAAAVQAADISQRDTSRTLAVRGEVALLSLMALSDAHLQKMADSLQILAGSEAGHTGNWPSIKDPLTDIAKRNVQALNWFALPDGSYWSVQNGKEAGNLSTRPYFPKVLAGKTIIGYLVVSKATGKPVAIVAVPVIGSNGSVVGVLGASVYLDKLGELLQQEMGLDDTMIFYSFDRSALVALDWDPHLVFYEPMKSGEQDLIRAFDEMLMKDHGTVRYVFRGKERIVIFRKSPVTEWWYAFGLVPKGREARQPVK